MNNQNPWSILDTIPGVAWIERITNGNIALIGLVGIVGFMGIFGVTLIVAAMLRRTEANR